MRFGSLATRFVFVPFLALSSTCFAQGLTGTIAGVVRDPSYAVVPDATVVCRDSDTGAEYQTSTGPDGYYRLISVPAGEYELLCLPLLLYKGDAGPCRAILRPIQ